MVKTIQQKRSEFVHSGNLKQTIFALMLSFFLLDVYAQSSDRKWNATALGGISVYSGDLGDGIKNFTSDVFTQNIIIGGTISRYLNPSFDATIMGTYGSWGYYPKDNSPGFKGDMGHVNLNVKFKFNNGYMIKEDSRLAPYAFAGVGVSSFWGDRINEGVDYPIVGGLGMRFMLNDVISLNYQATIGFMSTAHYDPAVEPTVPTGNDKFMFHTVGIGFNLGRAKDEDNDGVSDQKDKCAATPKGAKVDANGCPLDGDNDGVLDYQDKCPDVAGIAAAGGCPDADGDGVIDANDKCPNIAGAVTLDGCPDKDADGIRDEEDLCPDVAGVALFKGCPDTDGDGIEDSKDMCPKMKGPAVTNGCPDTDNDGVNDSLDKCPGVAGTPSHSGCPDTDADGVFDDIDSCITIPGTPTNNGCPELNNKTKQLFQKALQGIQFETGKAIIKPVSFPILDAIVTVMKENPSYKLNIGGHTDDVGKDEMNMTLSEDRAASVAKYLIAHGVDPMRVTSQGFGETAPVDTNKSEKGRTRNRRVELSVEFLEVGK